MHGDIFPEILENITTLFPLVLEINNAAHCNCFAIVITSLFLSAKIVHVYVNIINSQALG